MLVRTRQNAILELSAVTGQCRNAIDELSERTQTVRILFVIDSLRIGGAETSLLSMVPSLRNLGAELHVAYLRDRTALAPGFVRAGATLHPIALGHNRVRQLTALRRVIRTVRPDLVHTTLYEADILGRLAARSTRTRVVSSLVGQTYSEVHFSNPAVSRSKLRAAQVADATTARLASGFHAVSQPIANAMERRLRLPHGRMVVIPRGRSIDLLGASTPERRATARATVGVNDQTILLLAVARHEHEKGLDFLLHAIRRLNSKEDWRLLIAGSEGRSTPLLKELAGSDHRITFLGQRTDVADLLCAADVFVLPSRTEGFPGVVLEAMALGCPIIASDIPEVRQVSEITKFADLVPCGDVDRLGLQLTAVFDDPSRSRVRARLGVEIFRDIYTIEIVTSQMWAWFNEVLAK